MLWNSFQSFESGQVYEVVFKDIRGDFVSYDQLVSKNKQVPKLLKQVEDSKFLIYIVNQQVKINDLQQTLTFFKDITFGVLYEQIKAKEQLKNMLDNTLQTKIGNPLNSAVKTCQNVLQSPQLIEFERNYMGQDPLRKQLDKVVTQCKSVQYRLYDMRDLHALSKGIFVTKNIGFDLHLTIQRIKSMMAD